MFSYRQNPKIYNACIAFFLILIVCFVSYRNSFHNGFILDDFYHIIGEKPLRMYSLKELLTEHFHNFYRPIGFLSLLWMNIIFTDQILPYQILTFCLFVLTCFLFFQIIYKIWQNFNLALLSSILYAVHPINAFVVNYKTGVYISIFVLYVQISVLLFISFLSSRNKLALWGSCIFYGLTLFTHEIGFILPGILFLISYLLKGHSVRKTLQWCSGYVVVFVFFYLIRTNIVGSISVLPPWKIGLSLAEYFDILRRLISWYLTKLVIPSDIIFIWDEPIVRSPSVILSIAFFIPIFILSLVLFFQKQRQLLKFCWLVFWLGILPIFFISFAYTRFTYTAILEPHWFGFTSIAYFIFVSYVFLNLRLKNWIKGFVFVSVVVLLSYLTYQGNKHWKSERDYCSYWMQTNRYTAKPLKQFFLNTRLYVEKDLNRLTTCKEIAYKGGMHYMLDKTQEAIYLADEALNRDINCAPAYFLLGVIIHDLGVSDLANLKFQKAHELDGEYYPSMDQLSKIFKDIENRDAESVMLMNYLLLGW